MLLHSLNGAQRINPTGRDEDVPRAPDCLRFAKGRGGTQNTEDVEAAPLRLKAIERELDPVNVWRAAATDLGGAQERCLGPVVAGDVSVQLRIRCDHDGIEHPRSTRGAYRVSHERVSA